MFHNVLIVWCVWVAVGPIFKTKKYLIESSTHFLPTLAASDHCGFILAEKDKEEEENMVLALKKTNQEI